MAEAVIPVVAEKLFDILIDPVTSRVTNMYKLEENILELEKKVEDLKETKQSVMEDIEEDRRQGFLGTKKEVNAWKDKVDNFLTKVEQTMQRIRGFERNDLKERYVLSMKVVKLIQKCANLKKERNFGKVGRREPLPVPKSYVKGYQAFDSREKTFRLIMKVLSKDTKLKTIGVYGTGGVGKTMLLRKVHLQAKEDKLFDEVAMVPVTQTPDLKQIQSEIAGQLAIKLEDHAPVEMRAETLRENLRTKRLLVILDDVWKALNLEELGIPVENVDKASSQQTGDQKGRNAEKASSQETGDQKGKNVEKEGLQETGDQKGKNVEKEGLLRTGEQKGKKGDQGGGDQKGKMADQRRCTVLLVCRYIKICKDMKTEKEILVEPLSDEEGLNLFWKIVDDLQKKIKFGSTGTEIVKKCSGLPVAILTIAKTLKKQSHSAWNAVPNQLASFDFSDVEENFQSPIELSYKFLKKKEAKSLFLLCGIQKGDSVSIDNLVRYGMGLGWFQDVNTLDAARQKVDELITDLKASGLLSDDDTNETVRMPGVIQIVAQSIASRDHHMLSIQNFIDLEQELEKEKYKDSVAVSLPLAEVVELPERPELPRLNFLSLSVGNDYEDLSLQIPDHFFDKIKELKVLYLENFHLPSLSPSLGYLTNLRTLCLDYCQLGDISMVGNLDKLVILSFSNSDVEKLPEDIGRLIRLRLLDLQSCSKLEVIPPDVLSKLTRLEELYMGNGFNAWDVQGQDNATLEELKELRRLTSLQIHVMDAKIIPHHLFPETLERYIIFIGNCWDWYDEYKTSRVLKIKLNDSESLGHGVKMLLKKTEELHLDELNGFKNVHPQLGGEGFPDLKHLQVQNDPQIKYIIKQEVWDPYNAFPMLESIILDNLGEFKEICHGQLREKSFGQLKTMKVENCNSMTHLISFSMAETILHLQEIEVANCENLTEIVNKSEGGDKQIPDINFNKLHSLTLKCLPLFRTFGSIANMGTGEITLVEDREDCTLFGEKVSCPSLENLNLSSLNIKSLWHLPHMSSFGEKLKHLVVDDCPGLKFIFSYRMVEGFPQLENLEIASCESMKTVISTEEPNGEKNIIITFPKLTYLVLEDLPELTSFGSANSMEFRALQQLSVKTCPKLETFLSRFKDSSPKLERFLSRSKDSQKKESEEPETKPKKSSGDSLFDGKVVLTALKKLQLSSINIEKIWPNQIPAESAGLQNLESLIIDGCNNLVGPIFPPKLKRKNPSDFKSSLKTLEVYNCDSLAYLFTLSIASSLVHLRKIEIRYCDNMVEVVRMEGQKDTARTKTIFPELDILHLEFLPEFQGFCSSTGDVISLPSLSDLGIDYCPKLHRFVSNSSSTVMKPEETNSEERRIRAPLFDEKIVLPNLKTLGICWMENLEKIWHAERCNPTSFQKLQHLMLWYCEKLLNVFPHKMLESLKTLESLKVLSCYSLETIFDMPEGSSSVEGKNDPRFVFRELSSLTLWRLPKLKWFYPGLHISEWPQLRELVILGCVNAEIFVSEYHSLRETMYGQNQRAAQFPQTLFIVDKVAFPNLEVLKLTGNKALKEMWRGEFSAYPFRLKVFKLKENPEVREFPSNFLDTLPDLEKLVVSASSAKEIFSSAGVGYAKTYVRALSQLKDLRLYELTNLLHLCKEDTKPSKLFQSVTSLKVKKCDSLEYLVPASVSFQNLTNLEISQCNGLVYLLRFSTAKSLMQLTRMEITGCEKVENIITLPGDEVDDQIVFRKLETLELDSLPSLTCFYLGSQTLEFPLLKEMIVSECPKMEVFSKGNLIIQSLTSLRVQKCDSLEYLDHLVPASVSFQNLTNLEISQCNGLVYLLRFSTAKSLVQLTRMEITGCEKVENIITLTGDEVDDQIVFRKLETLELDSLPSLTCFSLGSQTLEFPLLEEMIVSECPKMEVFSKGNLIIQSLTCLRVQKCDSLEYLDHLVPASVSFQNLTNLEISQCNGLVYLLRFSTAKSLVQLTRMEITGCEKVENIITLPGDEVDDQIVFRKLETLELDSLPSLMCFCLGSQTLEFPLLEEMIVSECPKMEVFSKGNLITPKLVKVRSPHDDGEEEDEEKEDDWCWHGDLNNTIKTMFTERNAQNSKEE